MKEEYVRAYNRAYNRAFDTLTKTKVVVVYNDMKGTNGGTIQSHMTTCDRGVRRNEGSEE